MKQALKLIFTGVLLSYTPMALAADWTSITTNAAGDKFFVDKSSLQKTGEIARYWEYREFPQPNNAFLETKVEQPVHGAVIQWSVDCQNKSQRLRQLIAYDKKRAVIRKFNYGDTGSLTQPRSGSSASTVLNYVCAPPENSGSGAVQQ
jgi:hypothetical protein